jgi:hypothetical protein
MALFLSESVSRVSNKEISDIDMMTSLMEAQQEMAMFTESVLRADFILHEQCRTILMEAEGAAEAGDTKAPGEAAKTVDNKEKGFMSKVWEALVKMAKSVWNAVTTAAKWIKEKAIKFWNWVKEKYGQVAKWTVYKYKWAKIKSYQLYLKASSAAREKLIALLGGTAPANAQEVRNKIDGIKEELAALKKEYDGISQNDATIVISNSDVTATIKSLQDAADNAVSDVELAESTVARIAGEMKNASAEEKDDLNAKAAAAQTFLAESNAAAKAATAALNEALAKMKPAGEASDAAPEVKK